MTDEGARPLLLDLFCCQGGAATGYHRAGFDVIGVDIEPQPRYPFRFIQADAVALLRELAEDRPLALYVDDEIFPVDVIHASPPCQAFTSLSNRWRGTDSLADRRLDLLTPVRAILPGLGLPYVIENVQGAVRSMAPTLMLHGGMFGMRIERPRYFESNVLVLAPTATRTPNPVGVYGAESSGKKVRLRTDGSWLMRAANVQEAQDAMGMPWADWDGCREAIPPAYTEHIGQQLIGVIETAKAVKGSRQ